MNVALHPVFPATPTGGTYAITYTLGTAPPVTEPLTPATVIAAVSDDAFTYTTTYTDAAGIAWLPSVSTTFTVPGQTPVVPFTVAAG